MQNYSEGLIPVLKNNKWGFIDKTGKEIIQLQYDDAGQFKEGLALVNKGGKTDKDGFFVGGGNLICFHILGLCVDAGLVLAGTRKE